MSKHLHTVSEGILTELYSKYVQNTSESLSERAPNILGTRAKRLRSKSLMNARVFVQIFYPSNEFHDSSNEIARLKRIFPFKISSENDKTK